MTIVSTMCSGARTVCTLLLIHLWVSNFGEVAMVAGNPELKGSLEVPYPWSPSERIVVQDLHNDFHIRWKGVGWPHPRFHTNGL